MNDQERREQRYAREELLEARRQIDSTVRKLHQVVKTLEAKENPDRCKAQITLAKRRIRAFSVAAALMEEALARTPE